jgi:methoxymalonate biosynthesis acyl carrier protein
MSVRETGENIGMSEYVGPIRAFIAHHTNGLSLDDDDDIFATGYVNSLFAVQLVMWIERTFGTPVASEDLDISNFHTVGAIIRFIEKKKRGTADHPRQWG